MGLPLIVGFCVGFVALISLGAGFFLARYIEIEGQE